MGLIRLLFILKNGANIFTEYNTGDLIKAFIVGTRFDTSVISYLLLLGAILFFLTVITIRFFKLNRTYFTFISLLTLYILIFLIFFIQVADIDYYNTFNMHLSIKDTDYITSKELLATIWAEYPVIQNGIVITALMVLTILFTNFNLNLFYKYSNKLKVLSLITSFLIIAGSGVIGARGGVGLSNLNWGASVFSENHFLNQSALNSVFVLGKSFDLNRKNKNKRKNIFFSGDSTLHETVIRDLYNDNDSEFLNTGNILHRITDTGKPQVNYNVVIILLESWMNEYIGTLGGSPNLTPEFNKLSKEGILFENIFATGLRSNRGILSVLCSYPSQYGKSVMKMMNGQQPFYSLPLILKKRGYNTSFIYGGDLEFDNMKGFMKVNGIDQFIGKEQFSDIELSSKWGAYDEDLFSKTIDTLDTLKEPFFVKIFTLSNHEPFDLPDDFDAVYTGNTRQERYFNSFLYSDKTLGDFFKKVKLRNFYNNTIFLLIADHGRNLKKNIRVDIDTFKIPMLILFGNKNLAKSLRVDKIGSQTDVLTTIMGLLGGKYENAAWGRDLLKNNTNNFAFMIKNNYTAFIKDSLLLTDHYSLEPQLFNIKHSNYDEITDNDELLIELKTQSRSILKYSSEYFTEGLFGIKKTGKEK